jgi:hypothetical protein
MESVERVIAMLFYPRQDVTFNVPPLPNLEKDFESPVLAVFIEEIERSIMRDALAKPV